MFIARGIDEKIAISDYGNIRNSLLAKGLTGHNIAIMQQHNSRDYYIVVRYAAENTSMTVAFTFAESLHDLHDAKIVQGVHYEDIGNRLLSARITMTDESIRGY